MKRRLDIEIFADVPRISAFSLFGLGELYGQGVINANEARKHTPEETRIIPDLLKKRK
ncbi:MAG: hypothetical protein LBS79_11985 [Tannerella sp.]|nr:hypothetical protein [Tannerella sp.]